MVGAFQLGKGFGPAGVSPPTVLSIADSADGTGGVATITSSTPGSTNEIFGRRLDGTVSSAWILFATRVGDGTVAIVAEPGEYIFYNLSTEAGGSSVSNVVHIRFTDPAALGLLTSPVLALRAIIAEVASGRAFVGATTVAEAQAKIHTSLLEGANLKALRPYIVVMWEDFSMVKIAGGNRNYLWPREPRLRVLCCDNDPVPEDPTTGDVLFQKRVEQLLEEITDRAALDDRLAISAVEMEQQPARNPREEWKTAEGAYLWCSFLVAYD